MGRIDSPVLASVLRAHPACDTLAEVTSDKLVGIAFDHACLVSQVTCLQAHPLYTSELITMICAAAGQDQTFAAFTLSHVCGSWRSIILANRHLWSSIYVALTDALLARAAPLLRSITRLYLARSADNPLHISLVDKVSHDFSNSLLASSLGSFVALLNRCCRRWKTLSISELGQRTNYYLKTLFMPHPLLLDRPQLVSVVVCLRKEEFGNDSSSNARNDLFRAFSFINTAPRVSSLRIVFFGEAHIAQFRFYHIRVLVFESSPDILPSLHLPSFPRVQQLSLICCPRLPAFPSAIAQAPYAAKSVTTLIIHITGSGQGIRNHICSLELPSLCSVYFASNPEGPVLQGTMEVQAIHKLLMCSPCPRIAQLSFINVAVEAKHLLILLGALQDLETLVITHLSHPTTHQCREGDGVVEFLGDPSFLPKLQANGVFLCGRRSRDAGDALVRRNTIFA